MNLLLDREMQRFCIIIFLIINNDRIQNNSLQKTLSKFIQNLHVSELKEFNFAKK